MAVLRSS